MIASISCSIGSSLLTVLRRAVCMSSGAEPCPLVHRAWSGSNQRGLLEYERSSRSTDDNKVASMLGLPDFPCAFTTLTWVSLIKMLLHL